MDRKRWTARECFKGKLLLVIDRDYFLSDDVRGMVEGWGGSFLVVDTVKAGLSVLESRSVDAAIVDIEIDAREAFDLAERLDEKAIPFVFASSDSATAPLRGFVFRASVQALTEIGMGLFARNPQSQCN
ncbi:two-component SAPR family response regulator [Rhizobium sp. SG_E_25_P2]|uniref:hypothetical protein n=1 Tax=Rhizobium sp. SG_E_25_P2 TaxID=2879942 RepID=UPI0024763EBC|nr:hypothetical protein [Rhizobium sp. SG_E_25_P2]MDH6267783.1 two-component SAPR family response regulator [Rhizobium sp. SG_E_25_P2]